MKRENKIESIVSDLDTAFIEEIISNFKNVDTSDISDTEKLEHIVNQLG